MTRAVFHCEHFIILSVWMTKAKPNRLNVCWNCHSYFNASHLYILIWFNTMSLYYFCFFNLVAQKNACLLLIFSPGNRQTIDLIGLVLCVHLAWGSVQPFSAIMSYCEYALVSVHCELTRNIFAGQAYYTPKGLLISLISKRTSYISGGIYFATCIISNMSTLVATTD